MLLSYGLQANSISQPLEGCIIALMEPGCKQVNFHCLHTRRDTETEVDTDRQTDRQTDR